MEQLKNILTARALWVSLAIGVTALIACLVLSHLFKKMANRGKSDSKTTAGMMLICRVLIGIISVIAVSMILEINGVHVTSLITGLGVAGVVVGFALQDILKDVIMGSNILLDRYFTVGDVIACNGYEGEVVELTLKATKIRLLADDSLVTIANRNITTVSRLSDHFEVLIPAPYNVSAETMRKVAAGIADSIKKLPHITNCRFAGTQDFCDSHIDYKLFVYGNPKDKYINRRAALGIIQDALAAQGISIPFNQIDVHLNPNMSKD